jgi:hypothetical protein
VAGGMTFSEQRLAYLIGDSLNKEVIIGEFIDAGPICLVY